LIELADQLAYYRGALRALRFCEQRRATGRRFGDDADNRWRLFRGELTTADRIDLLVRDADAEWPRAFGARQVFGLRAVAEDEAFGAEWEPLDAVDAERMWREVTGEEPPGEVGRALGAIASAWELELAPLDVGAISPTEQLIVCGPSAIAAAVRAFAAGTDLSWPSQVLCVATPPAHRHLAAAAAALLNLTQHTALVAVGEAPASPPPGARLIGSEDAAPADLEHARRLAGDAGGA
jgi:hypothetical protein